MINAPRSEDYLARWNLVPDGEPVTTRSSDLLPVLHGGAPAFLKVATEPEERWGAALMAWWNRDDEASRIICAVAAKLHAPRSLPPPELIPLTDWFRELEPAAERLGGVLRQASEASRELLAKPRDVAVLHGDIHHGNILDFGARGWLAIDPKRLVGERGFDFANIFCNPDLEIATAPGRLRRQATVVAEAANLDRQRLLKWILAYAGLSAAWSLGTQNESPELALIVARLAAAELGFA